MSPRRPRYAGAQTGNSRRKFGRTWWGKAWIEALEQSARLDRNRLPRGRTYALLGHVGRLDVSPGEVWAVVQGSRVTPYAVRVAVRAFDDEEWERLLDTIATKAAHTAALLDGELPPEVIADASEAGVELLPAAGEVAPRCSCPDWADLCKHAAAVAYLVADVLDDDPFALLLLRGRTREQVLAALRQRRSSGAGLPPGSSVGASFVVDPGVEARAAWARAADGLPPLPFVPLPPRHAGDPVPLVVDPPESSGIRRADMADLAADAAERAWALCVGEGDGGLALDEDLDLVRRAAGFLGIPTQRRAFQDLANRAGVRSSDLARHAQAWRLGGIDAVDVIGQATTPPAEALEEGRAAMGRLGAVTAWRNRLTLAELGLQLRLSGQGVWYLFEKAGADWELIVGPEADPARALQAAGMIT